LPTKPQNGAERHTEPMKLLSPPARKQALYNAAIALFNPGDEIIIPLP
jgi:aspartate/methionine/tyrosine aminotransferase